MSGFWPRGRSIGVLITRLIVGSALIGLFSTIVWAQPTSTTEGPSEYTIKAVFLYNFSRYATWPNVTTSENSEPFVIGILGRDPFGDVLDEIAAKKTVHGRRIIVARFSSLAQYRSPCHILFVSGTLSPTQQTTVIAQTQGIGTMVVG